ncbi:restriction endonuclease subunit S [Bacteroides fragilis]
MAIDNKDKKILNVPPLRFPEFTEEWKAEQLDNIATLSKGIGISKEQLSEDGEPCILYGELYTKYKSEIIKQVESKTDINGSKLKRSKANDVIIPCSGETAVDIATARCVPFDNILFGGDLNVISLHQYDGAFMSYQLNGKRKYDIARVAQGVSIVHLYGEHLKAIKTYNPTLPEQQKIAKLLSLLDDRIDTQNKIIEDLKKLKSAIVEMLLCNQNGESFKLRDVGCFVRGLTYANEDVTENKAATTVIRANNLNYGNNVDKDEVVYVNKTPTTSQILRKGDIVICMANGSSSLVGKNSYYPFNDGQSTIGAFCGIYRTSYPFVKWLMQSQRYKRLVYQSLQGGNGAIANLNGDDILNMSFPLIENGKSQSIIFAIDAIEKSLMVNKSLQRLYYTQKSYLLKQMFI